MLRGDRKFGNAILLGPTGVGKTETASALSKWLFEGRMIKKDMGEYKHPSDGRRLFGDQYKMGSLTKEVTEMGSCVVLFDEIEKAHPEVFDTFLTLFDEGKMGDAATNLRVSFKNTIILMTTNLAPDREEDTPLEALGNDKRRDLFAYHFRTELLGRINRILVYNELTEGATEGILRKRVGCILARKEEEGVRIEVAENIYRHLARQVRSCRYGVRGADEVIINSVGAAIAGIPKGTDTVSLTLEGNGRIAWHAS
ncbi:MAG: AAA family ATPase [Alphaproteobacteria bacterium]|uniref:AAA family ATPase n=1 Tax=Candidatus Nitrobium versatile TaxID=2884831 RepID=A0A953JBR3_9BACT|nr:AAA family ATPase [Candidatus Nitrobium versatile]